MLRAQQHEEVCCRNILTPGDKYFAQNIIRGFGRGRATFHAFTDLLLGSGLDFFQGDLQCPFLTFVLLYLLLAMMKLFAECIVEDGR